VISERTDTTTTYRSQRCLIPFGQSAGWEAALLDHYQAMVRSICAKLNQGSTTAKADDRIGGSTYSFDTWTGHPYAERIYGPLSEQRRALSDLGNEVSAYNTRLKKRGSVDRVTFYFGQMVDSDLVYKDGDTRG
jgi:hypothetical protein